jgi:hypothetical protein
MREEFERAGELSQADAVVGIRAHFGEEFVPGGRIWKGVLEAFRQQGRRSPPGSPAARPGDGAMPSTRPPATGASDVRSRVPQVAAERGVPAG